MLREFVTEKRFKKQFNTISLFLYLWYFFIFIGFYNNFNFISFDKDFSKYKCLNGKKVTNLHLNSNSGIFINQNNTNFEKF